MDLSDVSGHTPRILRHCLDVLNSPDLASAVHTKYASAPATPAKYDNHPDITFFRLVKAKHHYDYHRKKRPHTIPDVLKKASVATPPFDPYSRRQLLLRLKSYTSLNWRVPGGDTKGLLQLNELLCAAHGWICQDVPFNQTKNHLKCSDCGSQMCMRFNSVDDQPQFASLKLGLHDIHQINLNLKEKYINYITCSAHSPACPWRKLSTPYDSVYYMMPYLDSTNLSLVDSYIDLLKGAIDNLLIIKDLHHLFPTLYPIDYPHDSFIQFMRASNEWLMARHFRENKENISSVLDRDCPSYVYWLAAMGWVLQTHEHLNRLTGLLVCSSCNARIFLNGSRDSCLDDSNYCHKPWCSQISPMAGHAYHEYFINMVVETQPHMGLHGEYPPAKEITKHLLEATDPLPQKRPHFDIADGLDRLSKLRKLYFAD